MDTPLADAPESLITAKPRTRMESWQRKLLDLSLRNNLLNTKEKSRYQLALAPTHIAELEDALAEGACFRIKTLPEEEWEQAGENGPEATRMQERAASMFRKRELMAALPPSALERTLRGIYTAAKREMEESGANTLYIACGFLRWAPKNAPAGTSLRAPLLLLPVRLTRVSVRDGFLLSGQGEDAQINHTLLELLKTEFALRVPELETELPKDKAGLDVPKILEIMRAAVDAMPGWAVEETCLLGMFSFAKYLMWRDLQERAESLMQNAVVRHLAQTNRGSFPEQIGFPELRTLDLDVDAHKVYTPLAADSSQLAAILAAARGKSFVLEGPPGTGKSQTIANMIAHCLGHGKTVLFVAEKAVALEVVHKRLERIGLGDFCLELHSHKTLPAAVMQQFRSAVARVGDQAAVEEWDEDVDTLTELRASLNELPREMHLTRPDGETLYDDVSRLAAAPGMPSLLSPQESSLSASSPRERRKRLLRCAHELAAHYQLIDGEAVKATSDLAATAAPPAWEEELQEALQEAAAAAAELEKAHTTTAEQLGLSAEQAPLWRTVFTAALASGAQAGDAAALLPHHAGKALHALQTAVDHAAEYRRLRATLSLPYPDSTPDEPALPDWLRQGKIALLRPWPMKWWTLRRLRKTLQMQALSEKEPATLRDLQTLVDMREHKQAIAAAEKELPPFLRRGTEADAEQLRAAQQAAALLEEACGEDDSAAAELLRLWEQHRHDARLMRGEAACQAAMARVTAAAERLTPLLGAPCRLGEACAAGQGVAWAENLLAHKSHWRHITLWNKKAAEAQELGVGAWAGALMRGRVRPEQLEPAAAAALSRRKLSRAAEVIATLRDFEPALHEELIRDFATEDKALREKTGKHIRSLLARRSAGISQHGQEVAVLQRELSKKRMHMPLRRLLAATPHITPLLKPCFLMSPLSVAQYFAEGTEPFDVVIFDEASQIPVWDAIGAIGRGKSVIITGDSRQMPPTSFFGRNRADEGEDGDDEPALESILDECLACGVPRLALTWHYRSKSETLIAFSNARYYQGAMTTFPAPTLHDTALCFHGVAGVYESGATRRVNPQEARAVVEHVLATLRSPGFRYTEATSIGIVTFNAQQQKLINDMLEDARAADPTLEPYFAESNPEAVFVKNLENVQGDERGVIYFSTTYGRDAQGHMAMNFGPLNLSGGERRLNVAITRARYGMHVFSSMQPEDIDLSRTQAQGVADLRAFLEYARSRREASPLAASPLPGGAAEQHDALAERLATELSARGYACRTGVGASDYRVDIVVAHPEAQHTALAGITLDGPIYNAAHTARDRDVVRPDTMYQLGWRMLNIWALDWWRDPASCLEKLADKLERLRKLGPVQHAELPDLAQPLPPPAEQASEPTPGPTPAPEPAPALEAYAAYSQDEPSRPPYEMQDRELNGLILNITDIEAPLTHELLMERIAQVAPMPPARGVGQILEQQAIIDQRLGLILDRLMEQGLLRVHQETRRGADEPLSVYTLPDGPTVRPRTAGPRELGHIPPDELREIARLAQTQLTCLPGSDDHLRGICGLLGLRMTKKAKEQLTKWALS